MRIGRLRKRKMITWVTLFLLAFASLGSSPGMSQLSAKGISNTKAPTVQQEVYKQPAGIAKKADVSGKVYEDTPHEQEQGGGLETGNSVSLVSPVNPVSSGPEPEPSGTGETGKLDEISGSIVLESVYAGAVESLEEIPEEPFITELPVADKPSGSYPAGTQVSLSTPAVSASIYYTVDSSSPLDSGLPYTNPITLQNSITLKAVAVKDSVYSEIASFDYTVQTSSLEYCYLENDGKINLGNQSYFYINSQFTGTEITTIEYTYSSDGLIWIPVGPLEYDSDIQYNSYSNFWYREVAADFSGLADGDYYLRVTAVNVDGDTISEDYDLTKDIIPPSEVTGLTAGPNTDNNAMILNWTNPGDDFDHVNIYRFFPDEYYGEYSISEKEYVFMDEEEMDGEWELVEQTEGNTFTDTQVEPYNTYSYKVVTVDTHGNESEGIDTVGAMDATPITFVEWYLEDDGLVNADNVENYGVEASFGAANDITAIDYKISTDATFWQEPVITYDDSLYYSSWSNRWYHYVSIDTTDLADGEFWLQATATDSDSNTLTVQEKVIKDTVADNVTGFTVTPNDLNKALVLNWTNPADIRYVEIYKWVYYSGDTGSGYWRYLDDTWGSPEINTYTDTNVYPYKSYTYKIVAYDQNWNESANPPQVTGALAVDGPITFARWNAEDDGKITASNVLGYDLTAYYLAAKNITAIDYSYSSDGTSWLSLEPYISYGGSIYNNSAQAEWYRSVTLNMGGSYGISDGTYLFRATAVDVDGNSLSVERYVYKDSTRPENVSGFTAELNPEKTGFILNWTNPGEDFDHVIIQRNDTYLSQNLIGSTYTDTLATPGVPLIYKVIVVDKFGNRSENPPQVNTVLPVQGPVFNSMNPYEGMKTRSESISYSAEFTDDKEITSILFDVSTDGQLWTSLNAANAKPGTPYNNRYTVSGTWDIKNIGEAAYQIRATATDIDARSTSVSRWVYIDRVAPSMPEGFTAISTSDGIRLSWNLAGDVRYYELRREINGSYSNSWYIYSPEFSYIDRYAQKNTVYTYKLKPVDALGNEGPVAVVYGEWYTGPELTLDGGPEVAVKVSNYTLSGITEPGAGVTVNGNSVTVNDSGRFSYEATLVSGLNTFTVVATNASGTHTSVQKVTLDSVVPYVYVLNPQDNTVLKGTSYQLRAGATDYDGSGISKIEFQVSMDDSKTWHLIGTLPSDKLSLSNGDYYDPVAGKYWPSWSGYLYWDTTLSVGVYGPLEEGAYKFRAIAYDKASNPSNGTPVRIWQIDNTGPTAPVGLNVVSSLDQINLSWTANTEKDLRTYSTYMVYRSTTPGAGHVLVGYSDTTTYTDKDVKGGITYYYVLKAVDKNGNESAFSAEVSCQPLLDTVAPVITGASPAEGSTVGGATVNVSISATDNSKGIKTFKYEYSTDQGVTWQTMNGYTSVWNNTGYKTWDTTNLSSGNYVIRLSAVDYSNNTSSVTRFINLDLDCSPVQNLTAVPGEGAVILNWDAVTDVDCSGYYIFKSTYLTGGFSQLTSVNKNTLTYRDTSVALGKTYYYQVYSYDNYGNRSKVSPVAWSKPGDDMTPPVVTLINPADGSATGGPKISFYARATDNKAVTVMDAVYSRDGGSTWETMILSKSSPYQGGYSPNIYYQSDFVWTTTGLPSGSYQVRITASDNAGNKGTSDVTWTLDKTVSAVVNLEATPGDASIKLDWQPITDTDAGGYLISRSDNPGGPYSVITGYWSYGYWYQTWLPATQNSYTDTGLRPGTTYYYKVISRDTWDNRAESGIVSGTTWADELAPAIISVDPVNGTTIGGNTSKTLSVYFNDNYGMIGATATIEYSSAPNTWIPIAGKIYGPSKGTYDTYPRFYGSWDLSSLETGLYSVRYVVYDGSGNYTTETVSYQVDRTAPQAPKNLVATYGSGSVSLVWETPFNADVKYYKVYRANALEGPYSLLTQVNGGMSVTYSDSTVQTGLTYFYKLTAVDYFEQEGEASNIAAAAALSDTVPPVVLGISPDNGTVFWNQAEITVRAEDNLALSRITLEYSADQGITWNEINTIATRDNATFTWNTEDLSGPMQVRAIARDSVGNISNGNPVRSYIIDKQGPGQVTGLNYTAGATMVQLRWNDVSDPDFAYFRVERRDAPDGDYVVVGKVSNTLGYTVYGLKPGTEYWFRVVAYDKSGNRGTPSDEISAITTADTVLPWISSISPAPGWFTDEIPLVITGEDNFSVASVTIQYSIDQTEWTDIVTINPEGAPVRAVVNYNWDISAIPEGSVYMRAYATDSAGNTGHPSAAYQYKIDRAEPAQPSGLVAVSSSGYITVTWNKNTEADVAGYNLYRAEAAVGPYDRLYSKIGNLSVRDRDVVPQKTYYYKVSAVDFSGMEGTPAGPVSASLLPDNEVPQIISLGPNSGSTLGANPRIYVLASDNYRLTRVKLEYQQDGSAPDSWTLIESKEVDIYGEVLIYEWKTTGLSDGTYQVRAVAYDQAGNTSLPGTAAYTLNVDPPRKPVVTATPGGWKVDIGWTSSTEPDFAGFRLYRGSVMGGPYNLLKQTTQTNYSDTPLVPNQRYYYVVEAVDKYGNISKSTEVSAVPTNEDNIAPVAEAGDDKAAIVGMETTFDGTLSTDNNRIARYLWDFGDGSSSEAAQPVHIYNNFGTYTVSLTVYDPAGNVSQPDRMQVNVMPPQRIGSLEVRVLDDVSGAAIPGASVVVQYPDGTIEKTYTNGGGIAYLAVLPGDYKVYGYKTDFKPASTDASVFVNQKTTATVRLKQGQLVVGELNVRRMTLDEIIAAGIDVNAPENQWVYKYEVHLAFNDVPLDPVEFTLNGLGDFVGDYGGGGSFSFDDGGGGTMNAEIVPIVHKDRPEVRPTIAYLVIPGEARWLKEFFEVGLSLENTADPEFIIAGSAATLKLPDGLALAPTRDKQSLQVDLGEIAGGENRQVKWIIRGDKKGEYNLEAQFDAILQPFGDPVQTLFRTKDTFKVWGDDALRMHVQTQDWSWRGYPYHIRLGLENVSDVPVYNAAVELLEYGKQNYIYAPNTQLVNSIRELPPGETLWADYWLIPTVEGELDLSNSYVLKTGGNATIKTDISSFAVPKEYTPVPFDGQCPLLDQFNEGFSVELSWAPIEGATGYRIYRVRDDLLVSGVKDMVYQSGPEINRITLVEPFGEKDYIIMTLFGDQEVIRHGITGMSWEFRAAEPVITVSPSEIRAGQETELIITVNSGGFPVTDGTVDVGGFVTGAALDDNGQAFVTVAPAETGIFTVTAYDQSHQAIASSIVTVLPALNDIPAIPQDLRVSGFGRQATLTWEANTENDLAGYNIYQMINNTWTRINTGTVTETAYTVTGLKFGVPYPFAVTAVDMSGYESGRSEPVTVTLFRVPSTIETDLGSAALAGQPMSFRVTTVANSDVDEPVRVRVTLYDQTLAEDIDLEYLETSNNLYYPLPFDAEGITWYGPPGGFPLADAASDFRITFKETGAYGCVIETVALTDGSVLNSLRKIIEVTGSYTAPVIRDDLPAVIVPDKETAFMVNTTANSDKGTMVRVRVTLTDPAKRDLLTLKYKESNGIFYPLAFDQNGQTWFGPAEGFTLDDASSELTVLFTEPGSYRYKLEIVEQVAGKVLASSEKSIEVKESYLAPNISDTLVTNAAAGKEYTFEVKTRANSEAGKNVRLRVSLADILQRDKIRLQYQPTNGEWLPADFDEAGRVWIGPVEGFPLADKSTFLKVSFEALGSYGYTLEIVETATGKILASVAKSVEVKSLYVPPVISDNLAVSGSAGMEKAFRVSTTANDDKGKLVRVKVTLNDPSQREKIALKFENIHGDFEPLVFDSMGVTWFGPASGFALEDAVISNFKVTFAEPGSYGYRLDIVEISSGNVLATALKAIEIKSSYQAPSISDTLNVWADAGKMYNFSVTTQANSEASKVVRVRISLHDTGQAGKVDLQYQESDGNYYPLQFNEQGIAWFGPDHGFPLANTSTNFKVTFAEQGSYRYTLQIVEASGGAILAATTKSIEIKSVYVPPKIQDNLTTRTVPGIGQPFMITTTANGDKGTLVGLRMVLKNPAQKTSMNLQYLDDTGIYQSLSFDGLGQAWLVQSGGVALADRTDDMFVTFTQSGSYGYKLEIVASGSGIVLAAAEKCVEVSVSSNSGGGSSGGGTSGVAVPLLPDTITVLPLAAPASSLNIFSDVPENYWAVNEIVYLSTNNVINGFPDGTFQPKNRLTRAELAVILVKALELTGDSGTSVSFSDVGTDHWAYKEIQVLSGCGIMYGYGGTYFKPDAPVTREEMVQVIYNTFKYRNGIEVSTTYTSVNPNGMVNAPADDEALERFKDKDLIPEWAIEAAAYTVRNGLVSGISPDFFGAGNCSTREEAAVLIYKVLQSNTVRGEAA